MMKCLEGKRKNTMISCLPLELELGYLRPEKATVYIIKYTRLIIQERVYAKETFPYYTCRQLNSLSCANDA